LPPIADASDADIAAALAEANFPALTMAIAHLAGDPDLFGDRHKPNGMLLREDFAGIDEEARDEILSTALRVLSDYRDGRTPAAWRPDDEQLRAMLRFASGGDIGDEYLPMMIGELNLEGTDGYGIEWQERPPAESLEKFQVLVIGAGMSGICAAYRLKEAGILERVLAADQQRLGREWIESLQVAPGSYEDPALLAYKPPNWDDDAEPWPPTAAHKEAMNQYSHGCLRGYGVDGVDQLQIPPPPDWPQQDEPERVLPWIKSVEPNWSWVGRMVKRLAD